MRPPFKVVSTANPTPRVRWEDQDLRVARNKGPVADKAPAPKEGEEKEQTEDVGAASIFDGATEFRVVLTLLSVFASGFIHGFYPAAHATD